VDQGTRAVQKGILKAFPEADIDMLVVWISMMKGDTFDAAQKASGKFRDGRVKQFYDPEQSAGKAVAKSLGHEDRVAWDIYLFYSPESLWGEVPPPPEVYAHQLPDSWADQTRLFEKERLQKELTRTMERFF
jgi:hypothetical protein